MKRKRKQIQCVISNRDFISSEPEHSPSTARRYAKGIVQSQQIGFNEGSYASLRDLKNFYRNPEQSALATQLFFLFQRMQQIQDLKQRSLFENVRVADFLIEKDRLFAEVTLSNEELGLYNKVYEHITIDAPTPDLVIYLQAPIEVLKERITKRGNINEQYLTLDYLEKLNDAYSRFFLDYKSAPLLIINASDIDLESNESDYENLITMIMSDPKGINFVNPQPSII